jgi:hypothetical protein
MIFMAENFVTIVVLVINIVFFDSSSPPVSVNPNICNHWVMAFCELQKQDSMPLPNLLFDI